MRYTDELSRAQDHLGRMNTAFLMSNGEVVGVNKRKLNEMPVFLGTNPPFNDVVVPSGQTSLPASMRVTNEGPVQIAMLGAVRDASHGEVNVQLQVKDGANVVNLMQNNPVHIDTICGQRGKMYPLPEALYIDENRSLVATYTDLTNLSAGTLARIMGVGAKYTQLQLDPGLQRIKERLEISQFLSMPQFYTLDIGAVTLGASSSGQSPSNQFEVTISDNANFELHQFSYVSTERFALNIIDITKNESIINSPKGGNYEIPAALFCGSGQFPFRLHEPVMIFAGQRLLVTMSDLSGAANTVHLTLGGKAVKQRKWI